MSKDPQTKEILFKSNQNEAGSGASQSQVQPDKCRLKDFLEHHEEDSRSDLNLKILHPTV
jgi:hypothetical protein